MAITDGKDEHFKKRQRDSQFIQCLPGDEGKIACKYRKQESKSSSPIVIYHAMLFLPPLFTSATFYRAHAQRSYAVGYNCLMLSVGLSFTPWMPIKKIPSNKVMSKANH